MIWFLLRSNASTGSCSFHSNKVDNFPKNGSEELKNLSQKLNLRPKDFIRKGESEFKSLKLSLNLEDDDLLFDAMSKFPKLMERPIIVNGDKACIGRPPEKILEII